MSSIDELSYRTLIEKARKGILNFTLATKPDYQIGWHHQSLARELNKWLRGETQNLMVFMPPRHGKSELVSRRLPAMLHGLYPDAEVMAVSYLDSLAGDMCIDVQKIIDSPEYKQIFPDTKIYPAGTRYTEGTRNSSEHHIVGRRGKYRGQGVGGSFTGKGANFIIIDDPIKGREIADSEAYRERLWNFFSSDLLTRLETDLKTGRKGQVLITQTRWHEDDLSGRLLESMKKDPEALQFKVINYPAIRVDMDDPTDIRKIGEPLWPEKYDLQALNAIKAQLNKTGLRAWSSLYQQNPIPDGGSLFKDSMFRYGEIPQSFDWIFTTADTSYKEKEENDFTVFSVWGVLYKQIYLIDVFRQQIKSINVEDAVKPMLMKYCSKYGYRGTFIEPKGHGIYLNQKWVSSSFMIPSEDELKEFYSDRRLDKVERANNVAPHLSHSYLIINENIPEKEELVSEALKFPQGKHDDWVDTFIDALKKVHGKALSILDYV